MNPENYWQPRRGNSDLRKLEQFFSQILTNNPDIFEVIAIYTSLRNDQYNSLEKLLERWGAEIAWFIVECKVDNTKLGKHITNQNKEKLIAQFKIK